MWFSSLRRYIIIWLLVELMVICKPCWQSCRCVYINLFLTFVLIIYLLEYCFDESYVKYTFFHEDALLSMFQKSKLSMPALKTKIIPDQWKPLWAVAYQTLEKLFVHSSRRSHKCISTFQHKLYFFTFHI